MASMALLQPRAGPSLHASQPLSLRCPLRSICHCASPYRPVLQSFVYLSVFLRLSSGGQRYMNINSTSVLILETRTLRFRESITVQGHTEESKRQSECHPPLFDSVQFPSHCPPQAPQPNSKNKEGQNLTCQVKASSPVAEAARKKSPHPPSDPVPRGSGPQPQWARQASYGVGLTAGGQQAKQKGRTTGPLGKLNFIPSSLL